MLRALPYVPAVCSADRRPKTSFPLFGQCSKSPVSTCRPRRNKDLLHTKRPSPVRYYIMAMKFSQFCTMVLSRYHPHSFLSFLSRPECLRLASRIGPGPAHNGQTHGIPSGDISRRPSFCIRRLWTRRAASPDILHQRQTGC
jgi:hypothetical protein